jgi:Tol biopolymer transport system component/DNA-binding winged helix-turn-helix (wHTH) protein
MSLETHNFGFGNFVLDIKEKVLWQNGKPVSITPKVFQLLVVFVENHGRLLEKEELFRKVWEDRFVEEGNLTFTIRQLRKTLGDDKQNPQFIETVPRRGYRFIAGVKKIPIGDLVPSQVNTHDLTAGKELKPPAANFTNKENPESLTADVLPSLPVSDTGRTKKHFPYYLLILLFLVVIGTLTVVFWRSLFSSKGEDLRSRVIVPKLELLTNTGNARHAAISPDGTLMAYVSRTGERESLWLRQFETNSNLPILPPINEIYLSLRFAPDSKSIYFARGKKNEPDSIYQVSTLGGIPQKLISDVQESFTVSPDNAQISFSRFSKETREYSLLIAKTNGTEEKVLVKRTFPERFWALAWSPDGKTLACAVGEAESGSKDISIVEINPANGETKEISAKKWFQVKSLAWLPEKSGLIVSGRAKLSEQNQLWQISYPQNEINRLTADLHYYSEISLTDDAKKLVAVQSVKNFHLWLAEKNNPTEVRRLAESYRGVSWFPDGKIAYVSSASGNDDIWAMKPDGTEQAQLTTDDSTDYLPRVSPDGRFIIFVSDRGGKNHIWRMKPDGSEQTQLTNGNGEQCPSISPDGKWIVYHIDELKVFKYSLETGENIKLTDDTGFRPEVSPDGQFVAFFHGLDGKSASELYIVNFADGKVLKKFPTAGTMVSSWRMRWTPDGKGIWYGAFDENNVANLWLQPVDGGQPDKITNFTEYQIFDFDYLPSNQQFVSIRGAWNQDAVLIKDLR